MSDTSCWRWLPAADLQKQWPETAEVLSTSKLVPADHTPATATSWEEEEERRALKHYHKTITEKECGLTKSLNMDGWMDGKQICDTDRNRGDKRRRVSWREVNEEKVREEKNGVSHGRRLTKSIMTGRKTVPHHQETFPTLHHCGLFIVEAFVSGEIHKSAITWRLTSSRSPLKAGSLTVTHWPRPHWPRPPAVQLLPRRLRALSRAGICAIWTSEEFR